MSDFPRYRIDQLATPGPWDVTVVDGAGTAMIANGLPNREAAMAALIAAASPAMLAAAGDGTGALTERWASREGVAFSEPTGDGRDFTGCEWSWRDPAANLVPLMLQTTTEIGHFGAELAGWVQSFSNDGGTIGAEGGFYDSPAGVQFRDLLLDNRPFPVSVDGGAVEVESECLKEDPDFGCVEALDHYLAWEIIGVTGCPFEAFARASIGLATAADPAIPAPVDETGDEPVEDDEAAVAAAAAPQAPPRGWFFEPEPPLGDERLVEQPDGGLACPLTITAAGQVFGNLARWGQCHIGFPDACISPPDSASAYAHFHVGTVLADDGSAVATGALIVGTDHARLRGLLAPAARDHYANTGLAWADVRVVDGVFGPWVSGAVRPGLSSDVLRVAQASAMSGDWRPVDGRHELVAILSVPAPGFPIVRALAASAGLASFEPARTRVAVEAGEVTAIVAANIVRPKCRTCGDNAQRVTVRMDPLAKAFAEQFTSALGAINRHLDVLERRTRHLRVSEGARAMARIRGEGAPR